MKINLLLVGILLISIFFVSGCIEETEYQSGDIEEEKLPTKPIDYLKILDHKMEIGEFGNLMVVGTVENVAGKQLSYAEIRVKFYDKDNAVISTSLDNINDLNAGEKWKFKAIYLGMNIEQVDRYEIAVGSVW